MKNILSSGLANNLHSVSVASFFYRDTGDPDLPSQKESRQTESEMTPKNGHEAAPGLSAAEVDILLVRARAEATAETETRLRREIDLRIQAEAGKVRHALELFQVERKSYFSRAESDVVHLALAIAAKILHREAQVDPLLVAALVRVAVDKLHDGSSVSVRVSPTEAGKWREHLANPLNGSSITIVEDSNLDSDGCILETDLGSANFSIDAQLKEVEQGFFDLLAQRPSIK